MEFLRQSLEQWIIINGNIDKKINEPVFYSYSQH